MDAAHTARIANAITHAGRTQPQSEFKQTLTELRQIHGHQAVASAFERISESRTTIPSNF